MRGRMRPPVDDYVQQNTPKEQTTYTNQNTTFTKPTQSYEQRVYFS